MSRKSHAENRDCDHGGGFSSLALLAYALLYWLWLTAFVALKEEPDLRLTFGVSACRPTSRRPEGHRRLARRGKIADPPGMIVPTLPENTL